MRFFKRSILSCLMIMVLVIPMFSTTVLAKSEYPDELNKVLTDGKLLLNYAKPTSAEDAAVWLIQEEFDMKYWNQNTGLCDARLREFSVDFTKATLVLNPDTDKEEVHTVDVVWNYDDTVLKVAKGFIDKFPEDKEYFDITDLELVNYWAYSKHENEEGVDTLASYSSELKSYLGNTNFIFSIENRAGMDDLFYTTRKGSAKLIHNDITYYASTAVGARAEHVVYVPTSVADTKEALAEAAQKRIDDYIGKNVVKITPTSETVTEYYNSQIAYYDSLIATAERELPIIRAAQAALDDSPESSQLWTQYQMQIWQYEGDITRATTYKQDLIDGFTDGGYLAFLKKAAGDYIFNVEANGSDYKFVIAKDDAKLTVPSYKTVDLHTKVEVKTESSSVPLDTTIQVEKLTEGEEYRKIMGILGNKENETFDIKLHSNSLNDYVTKLKDGRFEVRIPISQKFEGKSLIVYYVDKDNKTVEHEVTIKDHFAVFTTDHFSIYTLAEKTNNNSGADGGSVAAPKTGDVNQMNLLVALMVMSCVFVTASVLEKRR